MLQVQQEVSRLQSVVADQLPQEKQRQQQRIQAMSQALGSAASPEVKLCCWSPDLPWRTGPMPSPCVPPQKGLHCLAACNVSVHSHARQCDCDMW